jgi:hypothetical protein
VRLVGSCCGELSFTRSLKPGGEKTKTLAFPVETYQVPDISSVRSNFMWWAGGLSSSLEGQMGSLRRIILKFSSVTQGLVSVFIEKPDPGISEYGSEALVHQLRKLFWIITGIDDNIKWKSKSDQKEEKRKIDGIFAKLGML